MDRLLKVARSIACLLVLLFISSQVAAAQQPASFNAPKLDSYLETLLQHDKFMGSVAIAKEGEMIFNRAYGLSHKQPQQISADKETIYRIGSITKMYTAVMVMQLVEEGTIALSQKLDTYYPNIAGADSITIKHLLGHQSGLFNFTNRKDYTTWMTEERSKPQMLELFRSLELEFSPGEKTSYSNTNYVLLGYIIEEVTGDSYASQLQKRIVQPLGLSNTYYGDGIEMADNEAASFNWGGKTWSEAPETDMSIPHGAGAIVSTPEDLVTFIQGLFGGELISDPSLEQMTTIEQRMGLGMMQFPFHEKTAYGHNGGIDGFQSNVAYFPNEQVAVALTANALNYSLNDILIGVLSVTFGRDFEIPTFEEVTLTSGQMKQFQGKYTSEQLPMDIEIFIKNEQLFVQATGQNALPLRAASSTTLKSDKVSLTMEFDSLKSGKYARFTLKQGGVNAQFTRTQQ